MRVSACGFVGQTLDEVKELVEEYENLGLEKVELVVLPVGELLPVQKQYHKEIKSGD